MYAGGKPLVRMAWLLDWCEIAGLRSQAAHDASGTEPMRGRIYVARKEPAAPRMVAARVDRSESAFVVSLVCSILPEVTETVREQLTIFCRMLNVAMAEVGLDRTSILTSIGKNEAAGVAKHMGMNLETNPCSGPCTGNHPVKASDTERVSPLRHEDERRRRCSVQLSENPKLSTAEWTHRWCPILAAVDVQDSAIEVDLLPFEVDELRSSQTVPETDQDGGRDPISPATRMETREPPIDAPSRTRRTNHRT